MGKTIKLTPDGLAKLENELENLKTVGRAEIAEKIRVARGYGDLSENSEYDEAKNEQAKIEARIVDIEEMLKNYSLIDDDLDTDSVTIGVKVTVRDVEFNEESIYHVVGSTEADPRNGRISDESPVGRALLGKKSGDEVIVEAPGGEFRIEILGISR